MNPSEAYYKLVQHYEGLSLKAYAATAHEAARGLYTIGYGHTRGVKAGDIITKEQAREFLEADTLEAVRVLSKYEHMTPLSQFQYDALLSMTYNLGPQLFRNRDGSKTGLYSALEVGDHGWVMREIPRWDKQGGAALLGLQLRRAAERFLYDLGTTKGASCERFIPAY